MKMIKKIMMVSCEILKNLIFAYVKLILSPFRFIIDNFTTSIININSYILNYGILPIINLFYYLLFILIIKNMRRVQYRRVILALYKEKWFFNEIHRPEHIMFSYKNIFKYILYNHKTKTGISPPFVGKHYATPGLVYQLKYLAKAKHPGWKTDRAIFFHGPKTKHNTKLVDQITRIWKHSSAESKLFDSIEIYSKNLILFYRRLFRRLPEEVFYIITKMIYLMNKSTTTKNDASTSVQKVSFFNIRRMINVRYGTRITDFLFREQLNMYISFIKYLYSILLILFPKILKLNFSWITFSSKFLKNYYFKLVSIGEIPTERSIITSALFGQGGNLYLDTGYFIRNWNLNLVKHENPFAYVDRIKKYNMLAFEHNLLDKARILERRDSGTDKINLHKVGTRPIVKVSSDLMMAANTKVGYFDNLIKYRMGTDKFFSDNYKPYIQFDGSPDSYGFSYPITSSKAKFHHLDNMVNFQMLTRLPQDQATYKKSFLNIKVTKRKRKTIRNRFFNKSSPRRWTNSNTYTAHKIRTRAPLKRDISRHSLENVPHKDFINTELLKEYKFKFNLMKKIYSIIGSFTRILLILDSNLNISDFYRSKISRKTRSQSHFENSVSSLEHFDFESLLVLLVSLESMFYVLYIVNHQ